VEKGVWAAGIHDYSLVRAMERFLVRERKKERERERE
jgi:hypothetical protein